MSIFLSVVQLSTAWANTDSCFSFYSYSKRPTSLAVTSPNSPNRKVYSYHEAKAQLGDFYGGYGFENGRGDYFLAQVQLGKLLNSNLYHQALVRSLKRAGIEDLEKAILFVENVVDFVEMKKSPIPLLNKVFDDTITHLEADFSSQIEGAINNTTDPFALINFKKAHGLSTVDVTTLRSNLAIMKKSQGDQPKLADALVWPLIFDRADMTGALKYLWNRIHIDNPPEPVVATTYKKEALGTRLKNWLQPRASSQQTPRVYRQAMPELPQSVLITGSTAHDNLVSEYAPGSPHALAHPIEYRHGRNEVAFESWQLTTITRHIVNLRNKVFIIKGFTGYPVAETAALIKHDIERLLRIKIDPSSHSFEPHTTQQLHMAVELHTRFVHEFVRFLNKKNLSVNAKEMEIFESAENIRIANLQWEKEMAAMLRSFLEQNSPLAREKMLSSETRKKVETEAELTLLAEFFADSSLKKAVSVFKDRSRDDFNYVVNWLYNSDPVSINDFFFVVQKLSQLPFGTMESIAKAQGVGSQSYAFTMEVPSHLSTIPEHAASIHFMRLLLDKLLKTNTVEISNMEFRYYVGIVNAFQKLHPDPNIPDVERYYDTFRRDLKKLTAQ